LGLSIRETIKFLKQKRLRPLFVLFKKNQKTFGIVCGLWLIENSLSATLKLTKELSADLKTKTKRTGVGQIDESERPIKKRGLKF